MAAAGVLELGAGSSLGCGQARLRHLPALGHLRPLAQLSGWQPRCLAGVGREMLTQETLPTALPKPASAAAANTLSVPVSDGHLAQNLTLHFSASPLGQDRAWNKGTQNQS